jgi:phosphonate transport system ATP-binding protein
MDALRSINREDGLTVLVNLHHLDTARRYCDRIIALAAGRVVFDGAGADLTPERVRDIYGVSDELDPDPGSAFRAAAEPIRTS